MLPTISTIPLRQMASGDVLSLQVYKSVGTNAGKKVYGESRGSLKAPEEQVRSTAFYSVRPGMKNDSGGFNPCEYCMKFFNYLNILRQVR
ncbi:hypothetical protein OGM63_23575 [Plectonema radiosum NIES-515]|uniref:Uncharacterized protein n=1 Tax=Plectonema radiosum NIES-515 TaxID=2986073 RepID=A0ABT3B4Z6_9CYAN|nr:hypothetical protein [Plectonema radiosum]MCV3216456.1 hypothetical protein [Plectonema radiosum NIES-515]